MGIIPNIVGMKLGLDKPILKGLISLDGKCYVPSVIILRMGIAVGLDPVIWIVFSRWFGCCLEFVPHINVKMLFSLI